MAQRSIAAVFMRGGTSKGLFFHARDLPADQAQRDAVFLAAIGSPDAYGRQLDGMGGGISSLSKVMVASRSERADADVDYGLAWGGSNTDMDGTVQEVETEAVLHEFEIGYGPESGSFSITEGNTYVLRVGCWEGTDGEWVAAFVF